MYLYLVVLHGMRRIEAKSDAKKSGNDTTHPLFCKKNVSVKDYLSWNMTDKCVVFICVGSAVLSIPLGQCVHHYRMKRKKAQHVVDMYRHAAIIAQLKKQTIFWMAHLIKHSFAKHVVPKCNV